MKRKIAALFFIITTVAFSNNYSDLAKEDALIKKMYEISTDYKKLELEMMNTENKYLKTLRLNEKLAQQLKDEKAQSNTQSTDFESLKSDCRYLLDLLKQYAKDEICKDPIKNRIDEISKKVKLNNETSTKEEASVDLQVLNSDTTNSNNHEINK